MAKDTINKEHIILEIQRTAKANGVVLGWRRFEDETGIRYHDWYGQYWSRWGDAVREAGYEANRLNTAYSDEYLIEKLAILTRQLGHVPTVGELVMATKNDPELPSEKAFRRLGSKAQRAAHVIVFCESNPEYSDVGAIWGQLVFSQTSPNEGVVGLPKSPIGYVYLLQHGSRQEYKIGRTNNPLRREGEIRVQLPERLEPVHVIKTDDPAGIENYWHKRFASKRKEGEWFTLTKQDVAAFKRWKQIY